MKIFSKLFFLFFLIPLPQTCLANLYFAIEGTAQKHEKIKVLSLIMGEDKTLNKLAKTIKFDLEFTDQLDVELKKTSEQLKKEAEDKLFTKGIGLCLYLSKIGENAIKVSTKDLSNNKNVFEKEFEINNQNNILLGHKISNEILPILTGEKGISLSSLAYCKQLGPKHKTICVGDYSCKYQVPVVKTKTINTAPCWHSKAPVLFFSQFTKTNNRLMSVELKDKKQKIICSYDGLNMQPSFSPNGTRAVICLSGGKNSELYLYDCNLCKKMGKRVFVQLTKNKGNNASPCLLPNGNIVFCSDFQTGSPQIYYLDRKKNMTLRLTNGQGYCTAPCYCRKNNSLVYNRVVNHTFQLFTLNLDDFDKLQEKQITFNEGDKHEPSYSKCGRFIAFSYDYYDQKHNKNTQIAVLNCNSGRIRILTNGKEAKSFPRWNKKPLYS
jgi:tol-pal system beta propeller repeat protein TolB